jgi:branched-chain amino acid transport system substrate-binding protein
MARRFLALPLCAAVFIGACASPATVRETTPVRIGLYADLSASGAQDGNDALRGATLRVKELNAAGGIGGRAVELLPMDAKQSPADAVKAFTALAQEDGVCAVIGFAVSNSGIAVSPVADLMKVSLLSLGIDDRITTPDIVSLTSAPGAVRQYAFLLRPSASQLAASLAAYAAERLPYSRYATLSDPSDALSGLQAATFAAVARKAGKAVAASAEIPADVAGFGASVRRIAAAGAEAVYACGSIAQNVAIAQAVRQEGLSIVILGNQAWDDPRAAQAGAAADNAWFDTGTSPDDQALVDLSGKALAAYGEPPRPAVVFGWDAVGMIVSAVRKAGSSGATRVRDALEQTTGFRSLQGQVDMDRKTHRLAPLSVAIMRIIGGRPVTVEARYVAPPALRLP